MTRGVRRERCPRTAGRGAASSERPAPSPSRHHSAGHHDDSLTAPLAEWAARYAAAELSVLPLHSIRGGRCTCRRTDCHSPGKHPLTRSGKDDASTNAARVSAWWERSPWATIGIRLPSGLIVLDVDPRNQGATALLDLTRRYGRLPPTLTGFTGGGGLHIWLAYLGSARGQLCRGVDVKTSSGYVVAPPSLHASGRRYEWLNDLPTAPAPRWVRRLLDPPPRPGAVARSGAGDGDGLARVVATAAEGQRNNTLNWAVYRAYERGGNPGLIAEIRAAALSAGLPTNEVDKTIVSAARAVPHG